MAFANNDKAILYEEIRHIRWLNISEIRALPPRKIKVKIEETIMLTPGFY